MEQSWKFYKENSSEPVFDNKYLKTKIGSYGKKITTSFHGKVTK